MNLLHRCVSATPNCLPRAFHTSAISKTRNVLLIGGGSPGRTVTRLWRKNLPEIGEYYDLFGISKHLVLRNTVAKENIVVCFGKGEEPPEVKTRTSIVKSVLSKYCLKE
jgi:hypothetical protein